MMPRLRWGRVLGVFLALVSVSCRSSPAGAQGVELRETRLDDTSGGTGPAGAKAEGAKPPAAKVGKLPFVSFDVKTRQVRVECESLGVEAPLEFFCVRVGGSEHESVLRTPAKPSDIHTALLALGLTPGKPVSYSEALNKWLPPSGPPLNIQLEWEKDGKTVRVPAYRCMRDVKDKKEMKPLNWVFCGSRVMEDGEFAADVTGYVVSVVNFDLTLIDIPEVASNSNDLLEWQRNPDVAPPARTKVTMVIEPAGNAGDNAAREGARGATREATGEATGEAAPGAPDGRRATPRRGASGAPDNADAGPEDAPGAEPGDAGTAPRADADVTDVTIDQRRMDALRERWLAAVRPHSAALREAAQVHYDVITAMRTEQQRLIDEADRLQRAIDTLEKEYQDLTTPRPAPVR